jgi:hypothetical protein
MDDYSRQPLSPTNGHILGHQSSRPDLSQKRNDTYNSARSGDSGYLAAPARVNALGRKDSSISETGSAPDSLLELYGGSRSRLGSADYGERRPSNGKPFTDDEDPERSRWIHRDKLARIESQELQAAGIILPRARPSSRTRSRDQSRDQQGNGLRSEQGGQKRQHMDSFPSEEEEAPESNGWDLRTPEEAANDQGDIYEDVSGGLKGVSRIPVCKTSPIPIPFEHLERDTPMKRKQSGIWGGEEEVAVSSPISNPKPRGRSESVKVQRDAAVTPTPVNNKRIVSENSASPPKKVVKKATTPGSRTTSAQRPKTRSGTVTRDTSGTQRPPTRSGEVKRPEGDPPWLSSMYKPDPRLPPDQQLLPTVAKRLQQEQWEKEGKFGNAYDTEFRPMNDEQFAPQPEAPQIIDVPDKPEDTDGQWPLRGPKSPTLSTGRPGTAGGYSTMPRITSPVGSPQGASMPGPKPAPIRVQDSPEDAKKGGCGCCIVM